jgi:Gpi18-like mannosyltransferase
MYFVCFVYILYSILKGKDGLAFFLTGVCFGIKLQVVFILPFLLYLLISGKLKLYKAVFLPIGLFCTFLPAYICGASFTEPFMFFKRQVNGYSKLTLGCANIWHLINVKDSALETFTSGATVLGLLLIGLFTAIVFERKIEFNKQNTLCIGIFLMALVPMFLPHMHERYFYLLDVLIVVYCLITKKHYYLILLMQLSSGIAYHNYLAGRHFILAFGEDSVHIASWINLVVLTVLFLDILKLPSSGSMEEHAQAYKASCVKMKTPLIEKEEAKTCEVSVPPNIDENINQKE